MGIFSGISQSDVMFFSLCGILLIFYFCCSQLPQLLIYSSEVQNGSHLGSNQGAGGCIPLEGLQEKACPCLLQFGRLCLHSLLTACFLHFQSLDFGPSPSHTATSLSSLPVFHLLRTPDYTDLTKIIWGNLSTLKLSD